MTEPWTFDYVQAYITSQSEAMQMDGIEENLKLSIQNTQNSNMSLPNIAGLSLEQKESLKNAQMGVGNFRSDETPGIVSTCDSSRNFMNLG